MQPFWFFASACLVSAAAAAHAADIPCELLIKQLDDALKGSKVTDVEMVKVIVFGTEAAKNARLRSTTPPIGI